MEPGDEDGNNCKVYGCKGAAVVHLAFPTKDGVGMVGLCLGHAERWWASEFATRAAFQVAVWLRMASRELAKDVEEAKAVEAEAKGGST